MIAGGNVTAYVADLERAVRFYVETLGMKLVANEPGFATVDAGEGFQIGLHKTSAHSPKAGIRGSLRIGLRPRGKIEDVISVLENRGIVLTTHFDSAVKIASFEDPDQNSLYLYESS